MRRFDYHPDSIKTFLQGIALLVVFLFFLWLYTRAEDDCHARGGVLVKGIGGGVECVAAPAGK